MVEVSYDIPEGLPDSTSLYVAAQGVANIPYPQARDLALQSLFRLVDSVLAAPEDAKKRRVRKGNPTFHAKVGQHKVALDFLRCAGFMDADDPETPGKAGKGSLMVMQVAYIVRLTDAHHALADASQRCGCAAPAIPAGNFNPYQENRLAGGAVKQQEWRGEAEQLRDEVKKREQELKDKLNFCRPCRPATEGVLAFQWPSFGGCCQGNCYSARGRFGGGCCSVAINPWVIAWPYNRPSRLPKC